MKNIVSVILAIYVGMAHGQALDLKAEAALFERLAKSHFETLLEQYGQSRILALGETNHSQFGIYEDLAELLERVGSDPDLKFIVFERPEHHAKFYEALSTEPLEAVIERGDYANNMQFRGELCFAFAAAPYSVRRLFPLIRKINTLRDKANPLIVTSIDGEGAAAATDKQPENATEGTCSLKNVSADYAASVNREKRTARNFEDRIWSQTGKTGKVIVVYHAMHLVRNFESCLYEREESGSWKMNWSKQWLSIFLEEHKVADSLTRIVAFDEKESQYAPDGTFTFAKRQRERNARDFGVALEPFKGVSVERGLNLFVEGSIVTRPAGFQEGQSRALGSLPQLIDALIWTEEATKRYSLAESEAYLPELCSFE